MRQRVFEVLFYLIDQCKRFSPVEEENVALFAELQDLGFHKLEIYAAFRWMSALESSVEQFTKNATANSDSVRIFTPLECLRLDRECRGYLLFLEQAHILTPLNREVVIERALGMHPDEISLARLKSLVLMVLLRERNSTEQNSWMEDFIMADTSSTKKFH